MINSMIINVYQQWPVSRWSSMQSWAKTWNVTLSAHTFLDMEISAAVRLIILFMQVNSITFEQKCGNSSIGYTFECVWLGQFLLHIGLNSHFSSSIQFIRWFGFFFRSYSSSFSFSLETRIKWDFLRNCSRSKFFKKIWKKNLRSLAACFLKYSSTEMDTYSFYWWSAMQFSFWCASFQCWLSFFLKWGRRLDRIHLCYFDSEVKCLILQVKIVWKS